MIKKPHNTIDCGTRLCRRLVTSDAVKSENQQSLQAVRSPSFIPYEELADGLLLTTMVQ